MFSIPIITKTEDYLIIDKPAGILVHKPNLNYQKETLVDFLVKEYPEIKTAGDDTSSRPGIVHRLDAPVSGAMVVARTQPFFDWMKQQFKEHRVHKEYIALVYGVIKRDEGEISLPLKKDKTRTKVMPLPPLSPLRKGGIRDGLSPFRRGLKEAETYFEVIERFQHYTLVKVIIKTGRTHQIRAHFMQYGHSLVGDTRYLHPRYRNQSAFTKFIKFDRVFLHQERLGFFDRDSKYQEYHVPLALELQLFLKTLRRG